MNETLSGGAIVMLAFVAVWRIWTNWAGPEPEAGPRIREIPVSIVRPGMMMVLPAALKEPVRKPAPNERWFEVTGTRSASRAIGLARRIAGPGLFTAELLYSAADKWLVVCLLPTSPATEKPVNATRFCHHCGIEQREKADS